MKKVENSNILREDKIALTNDNGVSITYSELEKFQKKYIEGIKERSLIFIICTNSIDSIIFYSACLKNKIIPMLLDEGISDEKLENLITKYSPNFLFMPNDRNDDLFKDKTMTRFPEYALYCIDKNINENVNKELALLLPTSGSTGSEKFVRISYTNILSNTQSIVEYLNINEDDVAITSLPMSYTYGLSVINTFLYANAMIVVTQSKMIQSVFWELMSKYKVTHFSGVPYTYYALKKFGLSKIENSFVKVMTQAGGKLPEYLQEFYADFAKKNDIKFYIMYGQTEATARMTYLPEEYAGLKAGSVGIPIPGGKIEINDDEVVYTGMNVSMGYAKCGNDLEKEDEFKGVLYTGDVGYFDKDGFLYLKGRKDCFAKIFGKRVNLSEIEKYLEDKFCDIFLCNVEDECLIVRSEKEFEIEVLIKEVSEYMGIHKQNVIYKREKFLRNANGKIVR